MVTKGTLLGFRCFITLQGIFVITIFIIILCNNDSLNANLISTRIGKIPLTKFPQSQFPDLCNLI